MKKILSLLLCVILSLSFSSCASSDANEDIDYSACPLLGTWEDAENTRTDFQYVQFNKQGEYFEVNSDESDGYYILKGYWTYKNNVVKVTIKGAGTFAADISNITKNSFTLDMLGFTIYYRRVDDSVINKYLK